MNNEFVCWNFRFFEKANRQKNRTNLRLEVQRNYISLRRCSKHPREAPAIRPPKWLIRWQWNQNLARQKSESKLCCSETRLSTRRNTCASWNKVLQYLTMRIVNLSWVFWRRARFQARSTRSTNATVCKSRVNKMIVHFFISTNIQIVERHSQVQFLFTFNIKFYFTPK